MGTAIKHLVSDRVKPPFVIFDIQALWHSVYPYGNSGHQTVNSWKQGQLMVLKVAAAATVIKVILVAVVYLSQTLMISLTMSLYLHDMQWQLIISITAEQLWSTDPCHGIIGLEMQSDTRRHID